MITEGEVCWTPSADQIEQSEMRHFMRWLKEHRGLDLSDYTALWQWSVSNAPDFWDALWDFFEIIGERRTGPVMQGSSMLDTRWFEGARVNYAEHILRREAIAEPDEVAITHSSETRPLAKVSWRDLGDAVRKTATFLRKQGLQPGDRVASYMPNILETAIAMLATTAIGCVWSSAAPEFGVRTVLDRFGQVEPKLLFAADGYSFAGKRFDRRAEVAAIVDALPSLQQVVWLSYLGLGEAPQLPVPVVDWSSVEAAEPVARDDFAFERVASDHPLWVLYSSGTTGLPKAIVHSHIGMLLDQSKQMRLQFDLKPGQSMFFYTTAGWMMWNAVMSAMLAGASSVLYDGSPSWPDLGKLWSIAEEAEATMVGASPTLVKLMDDAGLAPGRQFNLGKLDKLVLGGAPATPQTYEWLYRNVKEDVWLINTSGGTDLCGSLVGPVPMRPVRAAEIQGIALGIALAAWDDAGAPLTDAIGELVVTQPFPSQPLYFWGDEGNKRYRETYFERFPGVWWHGDFIKVTSAGGCYIYGRSDATLNRFGIRIGTSEIYSALAGITSIADSVVVCCETPDGGFFMPMFVELRDGAQLDDALRGAIVAQLRAETSPRHVPDVILQVPKVPYTLTGKRMEIPVRKLLMGNRFDQVAAPDAMADPTALDWFIGFAKTPDNKAILR